MTGLASASSSLRHQWAYDVFINFRGEDTRHGFIGYLNNALKNAGVRTFLDDEELESGNEITPTLKNAIENSRIAITVFSKNYASSTFCLDELVEIHQCILGKDQLVLPIFYDVEPSEVRHQKGNYGQALSLHMKNLRADEQKIQSWRLALHQVANISGLHFIPGHNGYEYQFIERIVKEISIKTNNRVLLHVFEYAVGLEPRVKEITSLLQIGSNEEVVMVGICGIGGLGKTTIARALYNSIADNFEGLCFLHDVKEKSEKLGLERIQETMLSTIVGVDIKIQDVHEGVQVIKRRFKEKKILLILDNVDNHEQLKKLAGGCNWFSSGSRIIITTRDKHLLVRHGVENIYNMEAFNEKESFELLSWNAFRNRQVDPRYKDVLNHAITYAKGLPLALEVIGSNLCGKPVNEWESALNTYKLIPDNDIQKVLKVSYEGLKQVEKEIFLDIACFFTWKNLENVKYVVEGVYGIDNLSYSIGVLVDKCLINFDNYGRIQMHDLIRDMGREIVREESPHNRLERSRLWCPQDIADVLKDNTGTNKVRMIVQDSCLDCIEVNWDGEGFKSMKELKILIFHDVKFSEGPRYLPECLKVLTWICYPSSCLPPHFRAKNLVILNMNDSDLSSLETIIKTSDNLGSLNLEGCEYVEEIPDLSNLKNLKELRLPNCNNLIGIHDSIGCLPKLEILDVEDCFKLKTFPRAIKSPSLRELKLEGCLNLKYFPEILEKVKIRKLYLEATGIEKLPWSICNLFELRTLIIKENESAIEIPNSIFLLPEIQEIRVDSGGGKLISCNSKEAQEEAIWSKECPNRVEFYLPDCDISDDILITDLSRFMKVKHLNLSSNDFTILPAWMKECHFLETLLLNECKHLREVEGIPPRIRRFEATNCVSLSSESKSLLLSKELHGAPDRYKYDSEEAKTCFFIMPSRSIPKWFEHRSKGPSISFWFRHSFPTLCLCHLFKTGDVGSAIRSLKAWVKIDEELASYRGFPSLFYDFLYLNDDHLVVYYLEEDHIERLHLEDRWYNVQVDVWFHTYDAHMVIEESGMHVIKELCEKEDITFTNPYHQTLDSTWGNQEASLVVPDLNTTLPMLPWTEQACDTSRNQGNSIEDDEWPSLSPSWETPFVDESANHKADYCDEGMVIEGSGMEVNEQLCLIEDISFNNPYQDSTWGDQEQLDRRMKEKEGALDEKRRLIGDDNFTLISTICPINQETFEDNRRVLCLDFIKLYIRRCLTYIRG